MKPVAVAVYGDVMLDLMVDGTVSRMSPEAPDAPVLSFGGASAAPGGAANVAVALATMGAQTHLLGMVGGDPFGALLRQQLASGAIASLTLMTHGLTTVKTRFVGDGKQIMRLDIERPTPLSGEDEDTLAERAVAAASAAQAVVISDYAKGAVTPSIAAKLIFAAAARGVPTVVDSKTPAAPHFAGASVLKPNLAEIAAALGWPPPKAADEAAECAQALRRKAKAQCVVLTRGADGLTLAAEPGEMHYDGYRVEAVDVTGAGDAVAAGLALALASGAGIVEAARFANAAGAAAVTKRGTQASTFGEIEFFYDSRFQRPQAAGRDMARGRLHDQLH